MEYFWQLVLTSETQKGANERAKQLRNKGWKVKIIKRLDNRYNPPKAKYNVLVKQEQWRAG